MDINEIRRRLDHVKSLEDSDLNDGIHSIDLLVIKGREEKSLYRDFIKFVAQNGQDPLSSMAIEVLKIEELDLPWHPLR